MLKTSTLAAIALAAVAGLGAPAFAEAWTTGAATSSTATRFVEQPAMQRGARHIYDVVPRTLQSDPSASLNPAATGGGSAGYNEILRKDY